MIWIYAFLCFRQQRFVVIGVKSDWAPGFYFCTLDTESEIRLFADDYVCYGEIKDMEDTLKLKKDIDRLYPHSTGRRFRYVSKFWSK